MRVVLVLCALVVAVVSSAHAQQHRSMQHVATMEVSGDALTHHDGMRTVEVFVQKKKQKVGAFYSVKLLDVLNAMPEIDSMDKKQLVVVCESSDGQMSTASFAELQLSLSKLPVLLVLAPATGARRDSVVLNDRAGRKGKVDFSNLENEFNKVTRLRYFLPDVIMSREEQKTWSGYSMWILYPYDRSPERWLPNVRYIHVFTAQ